jgi:hypothetical protein
MSARIYKILINIGAVISRSGLPSKCSRLTHRSESRFSESIDIMPSEEPVTVQADSSTLLVDINAMLRDHTPIITPRQRSRHLAK